MRKFHGDHIILVANIRKSTRKQKSIGYFHIRKLYLSISVKATHEGVVRFPFELGMISTLSCCLSQNPTHLWTFTHAKVITTDKDARGRAEIGQTIKSSSSLQEGRCRVLRKKTCKAGMVSFILCSCSTEWDCFCQRPHFCTCTRQIMEYWWRLMPRRFCASILAAKDSFHRMDKDNKSSWGFVSARYSRGKKHGGKHTNTSFRDLFLWQSSFTGFQGKRRRRLRQLESSSIWPKNKVLQILSQFKCSN